VAFAKTKKLTSAWDSKDTASVPDPKMNKESLRAVVKVFEYGGVD